MTIRTSYLGQNINEKANPQTLGFGGLFFHGYYVATSSNKHNRVYQYLDLVCLTVMTVQQAAGAYATDYQLAPTNLMEHVNRQLASFSTSRGALRSSNQLFFMTILPFTKFLSSLAFVYRDGIVPILANHALEHELHIQQ